MGQPAAAGPPVLALSARALDPAAVEQMGHEMEVHLTLLPLRVVLFVQLLARVHACLVASLGGFREAVDRAARTAVADAVQDDGALDLSPVPLVQLRVLVHGPLVVVPSPSVRCAAVLLRLGDVHLHNEFEMGKWRAVLSACEGRVQWYNMMYLLRSDASRSYEEQRDEPDGLLSHRR